MADEEAPRRGGLYRNAVSLVGAIISGGSILLIVFALALEFSAKQPSPYIGIFTYMVFPTFFAVGVAVFLYGMWHESMRRRRAGSEDALPYPLVDLNIPRHRKRFVYISLGGTFLAVFMAFITYNAFLYSESVSFCGTLCHTVMEPEHAAYLASPHARVSCVDCHVGHGASWYVKAKISGVRQVLAVMTKSYPRPIPTPIENLRPARETCEECHWPAKFFGTQLMQIPHFRYDEKNSPEQISLGVKTGGGSSSLGGTAGIHWHMIIQNKVSYVAVDRQKQEIPWIEVRTADRGTLLEEYLSLDYKGSKEQLAAIPKDEMDCMDCHNRPTHIYLPPEAAVDRAMTTGLISRTLPVGEEAGGGRARPRIPHAREGPRRADGGDHGLLPAEVPRRLRGAQGGRREGGEDGDGDLRPQRLPGHEGELEDVPFQHRPPELAGVLPLPRRAPRLEEGDGPEHGVHGVPHDAPAGAAHAVGGRVPGQQDCRGTPWNCRGNMPGSCATSATPRAIARRPSASNATSSTPPRR